MGRQSSSNEIIDSKNIVNTKRNRVTSLEGIQSFLTLNGFVSFVPEKKNRRKVRSERQPAKKNIIPENPKPIITTPKIPVDNPSDLGKGKIVSNQIDDLFDPNVSVNTKVVSEKKKPGPKRKDPHTTDLNQDSRKKVKHNDSDQDFKPSNKMAQVKQENLEYKPSKSIVKAADEKTPGVDRPKRNRVLSLEGLLSIITSNPEEFFSPNVPKQPQQQQPIEKNKPRDSSNINQSLSTTKNESVISSSFDLLKKPITKERKKPGPKPGFKKLKAISNNSNGNFETTSATNSAASNGYSHELKQKPGPKPKLGRKRVSSNRGINQKRAPAKMENIRTSVIQRSDAILKNKRILQTLSKTEPPVKIEDD